MTPILTGFAMLSIKHSHMLGNCLSKYLLIDNLAQRDRASERKVLDKELAMSSHKSLLLWEFPPKWPDDIIQNGQRQVGKSSGASSVNHIIFINTPDKLHDESAARYVCVHTSIGSHIWCYLALGSELWPLWAFQLHIDHVNYHCVQADCTQEP